MPHSVEPSSDCYPLLSIEYVSTRNGMVTYYSELIQIFTVSFMKPGIEQYDHAGIAQ
jgi:hypothetical protein